MDSPSDLPRYPTLDRVSENAGATPWREIWIPLQGDSIDDTIEYRKCEAELWANWDPGPNHADTPAPEPADPEEIANKS